MPKKPEKMSHFFNQRVDGYVEHMRNVVDSFDRFYERISDPISIPFSMDTQTKALRKAGFNKVDLIFSTPKSNVVVARKQ